MYRSGTDHRRVPPEACEASNFNTAASAAQRPPLVARGAASPSAASTLEALETLRSEVARLAVQMQELRLAVLPTQSLFPECGTRRQGPPVEESYFCRAPGSKAT